MNMPLEAIPVPLRTRVQLEQIVAAHKQGAAPTEIVQMYDTLDLADVYAVVAWMLRHPDEVAEYMRRRDKEAEEIRRQIEAAEMTIPNLKEKLLARKTQREKQNGTSAQ